MQSAHTLKLLARNANSIIRRNYGKGRVHPTATMNDLPVPQGDFFMLHAQRNRKYNAILGIGIIMFSAAIYTAKTGDKINLYFSPPETYE